MLKKIDGKWALVSTSNPDKILKWFGTKKPTDEEVAKEERRVQYFKHHARECYRDVLKQQLNQCSIYMSPKEYTLLRSALTEQVNRNTISYLNNHPIESVRNLSKLIERYQSLSGVSNFTFQEDIAKDIATMLTTFLLGKKGAAQKQLEKVKEQLGRVNDALKDLENLIKDLS